MESLNTDCASVSPQPSPCHPAGIFPHTLGVHFEPETPKSPTSILLCTRQG